MDDKQRAYVQEFKNMDQAYRMCRSRELPEGAFLLNEKLIRAIHKAITLGIPHKHNQPGQYRDHLVKVSNKEHGGVYVPPKLHADIATLMQEYVSWINDPAMFTMDPPLRAAFAHYDLCAIHPFSDGNGRTARLVEVVILRWQGIRYVPEMMANYYYQNMDDYYWAFSKSQRNKSQDRTPFIEFVLKAFIASLRNMNIRYNFFIRKFAMRDFLSFSRNNRMISQRQHDMLVMLMEGEKSISFRTMVEELPFRALYKNVSERTARRDLQRLLEAKFLIAAPDGLFGLNYNLMDR